MSEIPTILALFTVPLFVCGTPVRQQGLHIGLFISLIYLAAARPILTLVPLGMSFVLFLRRRPWAAVSPADLWVRNPTRSGFLVFAAVMAVFCALHDTVFIYGAELSASLQTIHLSYRLNSLAVLLGPLFFGSLCDRKGPFGASVFLLFLSESAVLLISAMQWLPALFLPGVFLLCGAVSGFFTVLPLMAAALWGQTYFFQFYPFFLLPLLLVSMVIFHFGGQLALSPSGAGAVLFFLPWLICLSALALYLSWKSRFVLIPGENLS